MKTKDRVGITVARWRAPGMALFAALLIMFTVVEPALAAIAFGSQNSAQTVNSNTLVISKPVGVSVGDFLLAQITFGGGSTSTVTAPTGWILELRTNNSTNLGQAIYYKIATATDASGATTSYTWEFSSSLNATGGIIRYTGVDTTNPIVASGGDTENSISPMAPSISAEANSFLYQLPEQAP